MKRFLQISWLIFISAGSLTATAQKNKLIEFGWDYPDVSELSANLPAMQNTPFDGVCFSIHRGIIEAFDTTLQVPDYYKPKEINKLQWGKYQSNFLIMRGYGKIGGAWFDDNAWKTISCNMINLSKALENPGIKGILFDAEYYYPDKLYNPWTYTREQYPNLSFTDLQAQVKKRGIQFITALQQHKTDLSFLSIWLTSLIASEKLIKPEEKSQHALLIPFIEGILEGKNSGVTVIDGNEYGYGYVTPSQFFESGAYLTKNLVEMMHSDKTKKAAREVRIAQPLFYDGLLATAPAFEKGMTTDAKWKWMEENTKYAMAASDEITWFYSERLDWWRGAVNDTIANILQDNKNAQSSTLPGNKVTFANKIGAYAKNINSGMGYHYIATLKNPMNTGKPLFSYQFDRSSKKLSVNFIAALPATLSVYINNILYKSYAPTSNREKITLTNFKTGKIVILAGFPDKTEACAIQFYQ